MPTMAPYSDPSSCQLLLAIGTADYLHMIQVKSIQFSRQLTRQRGVANEYTSSRLLVVAVFKVHPLELVACLSVDRKIFGGDIQDASLNQDVLVVAHSTGYYRMYSLPWIIKHYSVVKATLGEWVELGGTRAGVMGFGVPLTLNITERPPLLFEVRSGSELGVSFGGSPTVYLYNPSPKDNSVFFLRSLQSGKLLLSTGRRGSCETLHYRLQVTVKEEGNCIPPLRSAKDSVYDRDEETYIAQARDVVVNELEVEKQQANAYMPSGRSKIERLVYV
ncbi:DDB1- and CUL4-associated factor 17-like isoform X4 [Halichondria panicea]|uniref:DDB1- and CUL4-associated factor 17-like isoform X4 n=1 Tax=Halichondria panicea TaxID=6063 RepID=UPI00312B7CE6